MLPSLPDYVCAQAIDLHAARSVSFDLAVHPGRHPDDSSLASTFPHHKQVPPDIKHHRVLATGISFDHANLPTLIEEIERDLLSIRARPG